MGTPLGVGREVFKNNAKITDLGDGSRVEFRNLIQTFTMAVKLEFKILGVVCNGVIQKKCGNDPDWCLFL